MSERGELEVLMPLTRWPTRSEQKMLRSMGFREAKRLARTVGGRVLGLTKVARAASPEGELAMRLTFAVEAPDATFERPRIH